MDLPTVEEKRKRGDLITAFKCPKGFDSVASEQFIAISKDVARQ